MIKPRQCKFSGQAIFTAQRPKKLTSPFITLRSGKNNEKYSILGLFEIPLELLSGQRWREKTLNQKYEVYFHDYALAHLMIWENYLRGVLPDRARTPDGNPRLEAINEMDLIAKAANSMADGDLVDSMIHG